MAIEDDFTVYPYSKCIRHTGSGDTVYTCAAFYSYLMDLFDEPGYMTYQQPMKYNTPTSYTMLNGWFLDNGDGSNVLQYLYNGGIDTTGYTNDILVVDSDGMTNFIAGDKDKTVVETTNVGPLLAYLNDYDETGESRMWVRDVNTHGIIHNNDVWSITGGTGAGTAMADSVTGDEVYANIYTIADFPGTPDPQVYIFQNHPQSNASVRIVEWSNTDQWDRGSIDVIIPVKLGGQAIDTGKMRIFVRQTADTFTLNEAQVSTTGASRTPIATETKADTINITEGEHYLLYDGETSAITAGNVIQNISTDSTTPPSWYAEVVAVTDWGTTGLLELRGLRGSPADNDSIFVGTTDCADVNGTVGDTYVTYDAETTGPVPGDIGKAFEGSVSGAHRILRGYQDDGTAGKLVLQVYHTHGTVDGQTYTGTGRDVLYKQLANNDVLDAPSGGAGLMAVTLSADGITKISGYSDVTVLHINGTIATGPFTGGPFTRGERVTWIGGGEAYVVDWVTDASLTLANVDPTDEPAATEAITGDISGASATPSAGMTDDNTEDFAFSLQAAYDYSVFIEGGNIYEAGRSVTHIYSYLQYKCRDGNTDNLHLSDGASITLTQAQEYIRPVSTYAAEKSAPFGTLAGGVFFGARGVWLQGMSTADANNIKLTDHNNNLREPFVVVDVSVTNTRVDDVITVFLEEGATGLPKTDQYTSHATANVQGDATMDRDTGTFPNDTPSSGSVFVKDNGTNEIHRYRYSSWATTVLTLAASDSGTAEAGSSGTTLVDTGVFDDVQRGDIIRRTSGAGGWAYVTEVTSVNQVITTVLSAGGGWTTGDLFETNRLVETYDGSDTFYIPYLDRIEDTGSDGSPGSETVQLTYVSDRSVVIRARNVEAATPIQPFITTSDITSAGMTVSIIRNEDEVYA
jgi:hypothetical protein